MDFKEIFNEYLIRRRHLKVIFVGSCKDDGTPNTAPKMLIDIVEPNVVFILEYKYTNTYANIQTNPRLSLSFMDDKTFTAFRLNGDCHVIESGDDYELAKKTWNKRLIAYGSIR